jgi:hypothetical protein
VDRVLLGDRVHVFDAPREVIFRALTSDRMEWLTLRASEIMPNVVEEEPPIRAVWSSLWPVSTTDIVEFELGRSGKGTSSWGGGTSLRFRWLSESPPDDRGVGITRQRLNTILGGDLRGWLVTEEAWRDATW